MLSFKSYLVFYAGDSLKLRSHEQISMANLVCYRKYCSYVVKLPIYMLMFMSEVNFARVN